MADLLKLFICSIFQHPLLDARISEISRVYMELYHFVPNFIPIATSQSG